MASQGTARAQPGWSGSSPSWRLADLGQSRAVQWRFAAPSARRPLASRCAGGSIFSAATCAIERCAPAAGLTVIADGARRSLGPSLHPTPLPFKIIILSDLSPLSSPSPAPFLSLITCVAGRRPHIPIMSPQTAPPKPPPSRPLVSCKASSASRPWISSAPLPPR